MRKKAITLVELIVASLLMGIIMISPIAFELFIRRQYNIQDSKVRLLNEAEAVVERVVKIVRMGIGDATNPAVTLVSVSDLRVNIDNLVTPDDFTDDTEARIYLSGNSIIYDEDAGDGSNTEITITTRAVSLNITSVQAGLSGVHRIYIRIQLAEDPTAALNPLENPNVEVETFVSTNSPAP